MIQELWSLEVKGCCWKFLLSWLTGVAYLFDVWAFIPVKTEEAQNTTTIGNFSTFPRKGIAPDFDIGQINSYMWKLGRKTGWT
jgi:hypothetical protein